MIAVNDPRFFKKRHAAKAGRGRQPDGTGKLDIRDSGIVLKLEENGAVDSDPSVRNPAW